MKPGQLADAGISLLIVEEKDIFRTCAVKPFGRFADGPPVITGDGIDIGMLQESVDKDHGHLVGRLPNVIVHGVFFIYITGAYQNDRIHVFGKQKADTILFLLVIVARAAKKSAVGFVPQEIFQMMNGHGQKHTLAVRRQNADHAHGFQTQPAGNSTGLIVILADNMHHRLTSFFTYAFAAVEHPGYRGGGYPCQLGNIVYGQCRSSPFLKFLPNIVYGNKYLLSMFLRAASWVRPTLVQSAQTRYSSSVFLVKRSGNEAHRPAHS